MYELTNEQRKCFGLSLIENGWKRIEPKKGPYAFGDTVAYLDGTVVRKYICSSENAYMEYELCEQLSDDLRYILPKTERGKPVKLTAATLEKRKPVGMCLNYRGCNVSLYSLNSEQIYYESDYENVEIYSLQDFSRWVEKWCEETTQDDIEDITRFINASRQHVKYNEGDVFRFKINRRLYGYGRILVNYDLMRRKKEIYWNTFMGKPLICSVYHIVTENKNISVSEIVKKKSLPSVHVMDNHFFYGTYEIIGNIPITDNEDYPIVYGLSNSAWDLATMLQCGKLFLRKENERAIYDHFKNCTIGFGLRFKLKTLMACMEADSNTPYWDKEVHKKWNNDLRNPRYKKELEQICEQFGISSAQLLKQ